MTLFSKINLKYSLHTKFDKMTEINQKVNLALIAKTDEKRKNVQWEFDQIHFLDRNLVITCPYFSDSLCDEIVFKMNANCRPEKIVSIIKFLYENYPDVCWEYITEMRKLFYNQLFYCEEFIKFLFDVIPDIPPELNFSINILKMPTEPKYPIPSEEQLEKQNANFPDIEQIHFDKDIYGNPVKKPIVIEIEVDTVDFLPDSSEIKRIIKWLEEKSGFYFFLTDLSIMRIIRVVGMERA